MADAALTTQLLSRATRGDGAAAEQLFPLVYDELRRLAGAYMAKQAAAHTLQPTALVHEAWVKLVDVERSDVEDRAHFFRLAASAMRSVLVDHARGKARSKRGGDRERVPLTDLDPADRPDVAVEDLLDLDASLRELELVDEPLARLVELRFFGGLTNDETAEVLGVSTRTVERGWRTARAWLGTALGG